MTERSTDQQQDNTVTRQGPGVGRPEDAARGVSGGSANRLDPPGPGSGGVPAAGADGSTAAREQLRAGLGERSPDAGREDGDALAQNELGATDDPSAAGTEGRS
jgi:hypothetical protein